jgi:hypothetical protein
MRFQRRQLLRILSFAFGSNFILSRNQLGIAAQTAIQPMISPPPAGAAVRHGFAGGTEMGVRIAPGAPLQKPSETNGLLSE